MIQALFRRFNFFRKDYFIWEVDRTSVRFEEAYQEAIKSGAKRNLTRNIIKEIQETSDLLINRANNYPLPYVPAFKFIEEMRRQTWFHVYASKDKELARNSIMLERLEFIEKLREKYEAHVAYWNMK